MARGTAAGWSIEGALRRQRRARQFVIRVFVAVSIGVLGLAFGAPGQQAGPAAVAAPAAESTAHASPPPATAVPAAEIVQRLQATRAQLQTLSANLAESHATAEVQRLLPDLETEVEAHAGEDLVLLEGGVIPDRLADIEIRWLTRHKVLTEWSTALSERVQQFAESLDDLGRQKERWEKTESKATKDELASSILERIATLRGEITDIDARARDRQNDVLTLQERVVSALGITDALLGEVGKVRLAQREQLLALDSEPLWKAIERARGISEPGRDPALPLKSALGVSAVFFEGRIGRTAGFLGFVLLVTVLVSALGSAAHRWVGDESGSDALTRALSRPFAGGILVGLLIFPAVYPERPAIVATMVALLILVPVIRLLTPLVGASVRRAIYAIAVWMVVDLIRDYLVADPLLSRLVLLVETLVVLAGIVWLIRPSRLTEVDRAGVGMRMLGVAARVAAVFLVLSIGANVIGNVTLAALLCQGVLRSIFLGIVLYGALQVLEGVYFVLLRTPAAGRLRMVQRHRPLLRRRGLRVLGVGISFLWVYLSLSYFGVWQQTTQLIWLVLGTPLVAGGLEVSLGQILGFVLVVWISILFARLLRFTLDEDVLPRTELARGVPRTISLLVGYGVVILGFVAAVAVAGIDMGRFALMVSALGVGIGIGLQDVVNNFVSGLILLFERPIRAGDQVEVGECIGEVRRIGLRSTTVRTWDGAEVVIPNSRFVSNEFTNWTL
ncbi:MAG: mechanosensitive ion channel domain-containing protein, partial [Myxococcota bacterium]